MDVNGHSLLVSLNYQFHHLVVVVEALCAMIARLIQVILILPTRMCLGHTIQECLGSDNIEILSTQLCSLRCDAGNLCLWVGYIIGNVHPCKGAQLQLAFLLQFFKCLGSVTMNNLHTSITYSGKATLESDFLPCEQILLDLFQTCGNFWCNLKYRTLTDIAIRLPVLIYMH